MRAQTAARLMAELLRQLRAGHAVAIGAQGRKNFGVGGHRKKKQKAEREE